ncbi:endospore germination permease [Paenibacillus sp. OV219]|uniref:GerAB/ArcD/ProY family transporter n=1 Tax=Paenibacillus sp. OV219 TaxID=1884377 RepID=UPI0008BABEA0|nr:endospore germination permease [Paenibacillus sp. OV219]SEN80530.1 spore germination protein (amino acid permease) [Paenibacillus sp. OV219]
MKKYALNDITLFQYIFMIHGSQVGFGLMSLPTDLAKRAGTDGWISLLFGWALAVLASLVITHVMKKHPDQTVYDLIPRYFGKVLGSIMNAVIIAYFLFGFLIAFMALVGFFKVELLANTPNFLMVLLFLVPTYNLARNQVRILGRYAEISFWGFLWLLLVYLYPLKNSHWLHMLPMLKEGWEPVLQGVDTTGLSFLGFEMSFVLYPFLKHKERAALGIIIGNSITLLLYLIVTIISFLFFSPDDIISYQYPTLKVLKVMEFRFLERVEVVVLVAYVFLAIRVWTHYLFAATFGLSRLAGREDHVPFVKLISIGMLLLFTFYKPSFQAMKLMLDWFGTSGWIIAFAFPFFLLGYTSIFGRKGAL